MANHFKIFSILMILLFLVILSCTHKPDDFPIPNPNPADTTECDTNNITYQWSVVPILENNCYSCHAPPTPEGGIDLTDYDQLAYVAENGSLLGAIHHEVGFEPMPPDGYQLAECEIYIIESWINDTTFGGGGGGGINCDPDTIYFQNDVFPLLISSCATAGCHDAQTQEHRVNMTNYNKIMTTAEVTPFNPENSKLWDVIKNDFQSDRMPPAPIPPLNSDQKNIIYTWITQGALNNYCDQEDCDTTNVSFSEDIFPIIQNSCYGCHSGGQPSGDITLTNYQEISTAGAIVPGNYGSLLGTVTHSGGNVPMPENGPQLSDCSIAKITKWINDGMPEN